MKLAVFGATGGVGQEIVRQALAQGHTVNALARNPGAIPAQPGLTLHRGNVLNPDDVSLTLQGTDAVLVALGGRKGNHPCAEGTRLIVSAMQETGVDRLIVVTSIGTGESRGNAGFIFERIIIPFVLRDEYQDKETQEAVVKASGLNWTLVRPSGLINGPGTGTFKADPDLKLGRNGVRGRIPRADVARFCLDQLGSDQWSKQGVSVSH